MLFPYSPTLPPPLHSWQARWDEVVRTFISHFEDKSEAFRRWFSEHARHSNVVFEDDESVVVWTPTEFHALLFEKHLTALVEAAQRLGLPSKRVSLTYAAPVHPSQHPSPEDKNARQALRELLVDSGIMTEAHFKRLSAHAAQAGVSLSQLRALAESVLKDHHAGVVHSVYAVLQDILEEPRPVDLRGPGEAVAHTFTSMLRVPALTSSKRRVVQIFIRAPGVTVELSRNSGVGLSPRLAAVWDFVLSRAAQVPEEELVYDSQRNAYVFKIPSSELTEFLGLKELDTPDFKLIAKALGAAFSVGVFGRALKAEGRETIVVFPLVRRTKGRNAVVVFHMDARIFEALRENNPSLVRAFPAEGLKALKDLDSITAGLVRLLAYEFHGHKHIHHPLVMHIDDLHCAILGVPPRSADERRKFRQRLRRAVERIQVGDLLASLAVPEPRWVVMKTDGDHVLFCRTRLKTLPRGKRAG